MTNRYPLIVNSISGSIEELPAGDNLDLTSSGIVNAGAISATSFSGDGANLTNINGANVVGEVLTANTVTNPEQLAITMVGALSELSVNGLVELGPIGNINITGGTSGQVISTDGYGSLSWVDQSGGGGGSAGLQDIFLLGGM